jgi:hypothetical protein
MLTPKLSASAVLIGDDFASKLEKAVKRSEKVLEPVTATRIRAFPGGIESGGFPTGFAQANLEAFIS